MIKGTIPGGCNTEPAYTRVGGCQMPEGITNGLFLTHADALFPLDETEFNTGLEGYVVASGNQRIFPVNDIKGTTGAGGEINAAEIGNYGFTSPNGLTAKTMSYTLIGFDCQYKELAKFNSRKMRVFTRDNTNKLFGTVVTKGGKDYFGGLECYVYTQPIATTGEAQATNVIWIYFTANYENELKAKHGIQLNSIPDGLMGVMLKAGSASGTANVVTVCGGEDVTDMDWTATMFVNESGANPTSVTKSNGILSITPSGKYKVASASVLQAGDIFGFEGVNQFVTV